MQYQIMCPHETSTELPVDRFLLRIGIHSMKRWKRHGSILTVFSWAVALCKVGADLLSLLMASKGQFFVINPRRW